MKALFTLLIALNFLFCFSQKEKNIWYFGDKAGIDFSSGSALAVSDGQMQSYEGCASISDSAGNLLFYTNGGKFVNFGYIGGVWNKNHNLMPNGNLTANTSCNSAAQPALIIPDPKNQFRYYIFTTDCQENSMAGGLRYHMVDMTLDNGLGDVIVKDVPVLPTVTESMTAIRHANGTDYWLIVANHTNYTFYSILINKDGIGTPILTVSPYPFYQSSGQLSCSGNGSKIGFAVLSGTLLMDFNNATGSISSIIKLTVDSFGCTFSPEGNLFYCSELGVTTANVYQFDINAANIQASMVTIPADSWIGNMQVANDGKIYLSKKDVGIIPVINNPDVPGLGCNYVSSGFNLGGQICKLGLPNFVNDYNYSWCDSYDTIDVSTASPYLSPSGNHTWTASGTYYDTIPNSQNCDSILTINLTSTVGISEDQIKSGVSIYPNPVEDKLTISLQSTNAQVSIVVINSLGQKVAHGSIENSNHITLELNHLSSGIYYLSLEGDQLKTTRKFVKK